VALIGKEEALVRLAEHRQQLLGGDQGCVLCALAHGGSIPTPLVETERAVVLLDRFGRRRGHLLVVSKVHLERVAEIDQTLYMEVQRLVYQAMTALDKALQPVQVFTAVLGATVPVPMSFGHFHAHVIPVYESDERARPARVLSWSEGVVVYDDAEAWDLRERILSDWPSQSHEPSNDSR
jgi:diadenosine tetraphosphate (Ap4A) HIT family hydrolase